MYVWTAIKGNAYKTKNTTFDDAILKIEQVSHIKEPTTNRKQKPAEFEETTKRKVKYIATAVK